MRLASVSDEFRDRVVNTFFGRLGQSGFDMDALSMRSDGYAGEILHLQQQLDSGQLSVGYVVGLATSKRYSKGDPFVATALAPSFIHTFDRTKHGAEDVAEKLVARL